MWKTSVHGKCDRGGSGSVAVNGGGVPRHDWEGAWPGRGGRQRWRGKAAGLRREQSLGGRGELVFPGQIPTCAPPQPQLSLLLPGPHLVFGQQLAPPVSMRDVVEREAQVMVTVLEQQGFGLLHEVSAQGPLQLQHLLWVGQQEGEAHHTWPMGPFLLQAWGLGQIQAEGTRLKLGGQRPT